MAPRHHSADKQRKQANGNFQKYGPVRYTSFALKKCELVRYTFFLFTSSPQNKITEKDVPHWFNYLQGSKSS